jgi:hypothetical protein
MPSEASLANLKPFKPGQSGNPRGRPRKRPLSDRYEELMQEVLPEELRRALKLPPGTLWGDAIARVAGRTALKSTEAGILQRKEIADRIEGKATQRVELGGTGGGPPEFVVVYAAPLRGAKTLEDIGKTIDVDASPPQLPASEDESSEGSKE